MQDKEKSWTLLDELGHHNQLHWLCVGDFNEILSMEEKEGGPLRNDRQMQGFRNIVDKLGFRDLGFNGYKFTWKRRFGDGFIKVRLDRALASTSWQNIFPSFSVQHLDPRRSDHLPILVRIRHATCQISRYRGFHFEAMWTTHVECE